MKRPTSIRVRLVLWTVTLEALLLLLLAVVSLGVLRSTLNNEINKTLELSSAQLNAVVDVQGDGRYSVPLQDTAVLRQRGVSAWIITPDGTASMFIGATESAPVPDALPAPGSYLDTQLPTGQDVRLLLEPLSEGPANLGTMILALPLGPSRSTISQVLLSLGIAIPLVLLLSASGGLFLTRRALAPVADMTETARQIGAADLSRRIEINIPDDEIGNLARTFNNMLERLERAFEHERRLTADVSHELRTPLGMLKAQLSLARSRPRDTPELLDMMNAMEGDVDRMTRLIEQMLTLARVDQRGLDAREEVSLRNLLTDVHEEMQTPSAERGVRLTLSLPPTGALVVSGEAERLRQVFTNLVENGLKHTAPAGSVSVSAVTDAPRILVTVADTGEGIPSEALPHVFERFYRADDARSRETGGFGLGLAIALAIVHAHDGNIEVSTRSGAGTLFTVSLPAVPRSTST
ncbi:MAG: sensor histidine kinase [Thermoleophilia bacterium]